MSFGMLYLANFLFSFHFFFTIFYNSNFLGTRGILEGSVGFLYIAGSLATLLGMFTLSSLLRRFGNYRVMLALIAIELLVFLTLALASSLLPIVVAFILYLSLSSLIILCADIFLESTIKDEGATGSIRGAFLTTTNIALVGAPLIAGFFLERSSFEFLYLIAAGILVPFFIIIAWRFKDFTDPPYRRPRIMDALRTMQRVPDIMNIYLAHLFMRIFFSIMAIYMPLYLYRTIGFSLSELGIMFSIMLLPFALFEFPLGKIADRYLGEKEILIVGFIILAASTASLSFITSASLAVWAGLLFVTRTGASAIEIATESYFFKHVNGKDTAQISMFRATRPFSDIIGPTIGSVSLLFIDLRFLFLVLGIFLLLGITVASRINDTR